MSLECPNCGASLQIRAVDPEVGKALKVYHPDGLWGVEKAIEMFEGRILASTGERVSRDLLVEDSLECPRCHTLTYPYNEARNRSLAQGMNRDVRGKGNFWLEEVT